MPTPSPPCFRVLNSQLIPFPRVHQEAEGWGRLAHVLHWSLLSPAMKAPTLGPPTFQVLVGTPGREPPLDFFDSNSQDLSHLGQLGLADPGCGDIVASVLQRTGRGEAR